MEIIDKRDELLDRLSKIKNQSQSEETETKKDERRTPLPFMGNQISFHISRLLMTHCEWKTTFIPGTKTRTLYRSVKDNDNHNAGGCYAVPCKTCNAEYIGRTLRPLDIRKEEHHRDVSAVALHKKNTGHVIDYENTHFIIRNSRELTTKWIEAILIPQSTKPLMNRKRDRGIKIPSVWSPCIPNFNYNQNAVGPTVENKQNDCNTTHAENKTRPKTTTTNLHYKNFIPQSIETPDDDDS